MRRLFSPTNLRGTLYVVGAGCIYVSANFLTIHNWREVVVFCAGLLGNLCLTFRAYLDQSKTKYQVDKLIAQPDAPNSSP